MNLHLSDGKLVKFEPRRWYVVNTRKNHSGFCFKDGTVHLACGIYLYSRGETHKLTKGKPSNQYTMVTRCTTFCTATARY